MAITTEQIKELRDQTGVSIMQVKKALEEAGGDKEKAMVILRKKSGEMSAKKSDRTFKAVIGYSVRAKDSSAAGQSILAYDPQSALAESYRTLADEILSYAQAA